MSDLAKEAIRWLFGGGALALATFLGTTAYQQGQLEIEREARLAQIQIDRERYLRDFLDKYVALATKGTLDERIRFVLYWKHLNVDEKIGVDLGDYEQALIAEFNEAETFAKTLLARQETEDASPSPQPAAGGGDGGQIVSAGKDPDTNTEQPSQPDPPEVKAQPPAQTATSSDYPAYAQQAPAAQQEAYFASRSQTLAKLVPSASDAPALERKGFEALLDNDIPAARDAFAAAEKAWPEYHNVAEIRALLDRLAKTLPAGVKSLPVDTHRETLKTILNDYSWGMPADLRTRTVSIGVRG